MSTPANTRIQFVLFATGVTAIGGFLFGYDTAVINGANSYLKTHLHLDATQEGLAGASAIIGCIPGAMFSGFLSDRFGRRKLLFLCALLYAVSGVLSAIPNTFNQFLAARIISGLGIGASSMICPVYIAEISPEKWRGRLGTLFQLGIVVGIFLTLFINKVIQGMGDDIWNAAYGWRWMLGMEVVPALAFIGLLFAVPESPRWLAQNGREAEARGILEKVGGAEHAATELSAIREVGSHEQGSLGELVCGPFLKPLLIAVVLMACSQFCGINAIMYYSSKIFEEAGGGKNAAFTSTVWVGLINFAFTFVAIGLVDRVGRRPLLLIGTAVQVLALAAVGWMFHAQVGGTPLLVCVVLFIAAFAMALGPVGWLFCSEIFPNKVRGRAMSLAALTVWVSCFVVAQTFPMLNASPVNVPSPTFWEQVKNFIAIGPALTFWAYAFVSLFAFIFVLVLLPETKGRTLEQIETSWGSARRGSTPAPM